jgi:hypothetical protein
MSTADAQLDQQMAACRDIHAGLVQLARDALADGIPAQVLLREVIYRTAMEHKPGQIAAAYACAVMRDAERAP